MYKLISLLIAAAGIVAFTSAQPPCHAEKLDSCHRDHRVMHRKWEALDLDEQQKEKLKSLHEDARERRKKHFELIRDVKAKMRDELLKDAPDEKTLSSYADKIGNLRTRATQQEIDHLLKIKGVLDAQQFETLLDHHARRHNCKEDKKHGRDHGPGKKPHPRRHHR